MMSFGPPGANPTMTRTGREGQDCASAGACRTIAPASSSHRVPVMSALSLVRHDGVAAYHRLPGGSFLFQVSGEELRGVEYRDQGFVLELPGEPRRLHRAADLRAHALHDRRGCPRRCDHAEGAVDFQARKSGL